MPLATSGMSIYEIFYCYASLYQSLAYIAEFHSQVGVAVRQLVGEDFDCVLFNDG